jgi:hypothetical protein
LPEIPIGFLRPGCVCEPPGGGAATAQCENAGQTQRFLAPPVPEEIIRKVQYGMEIPRKFMKINAVK